MRPYHELGPLRGLLLEESHVLDISAVPGGVTFDLDLALATEHPDYEAPAPGERLCLRSARMSFTDVRTVLWSSADVPPPVDPGEKGHGQLHSFAWDHAGHVLEGDWGRMEIICLGVEVELT